mmetsp:Transcript_19514/g.63408  ORF Transcript_19514/g.63408 Transcript_19514/m.63408 type:complete len:186 (-) Transcript_19514:2065-2622(-)|eukprot:CAMPEP_0170139300 /NCGR_PEP_ID=MMETSP0033_2-20121228/5548_1 /TAXON_ID=195969 /ORGANISM="Dolichomastix tenuilepis, Strain CCMP3274" /LENGTH=185 /DNA_ID=CAMNT_0010375399 /DNA_START=46 /DNA_END=603 /DNA_ORIENTATION=-
MLVLVCLSALLLLASAERPPTDDKPRVARWLVHNADWATVSTTHKELNGAPWGNVASISDGAGDDATGRVFMYLTTMDATAADAEESPTSSVTLSEKQLPGGCDGRYAEDPPCARLTLTGKLAQVASADVPLAQSAIFGRFPDMQKWPTGHEFAFYELTIENIFFLDFYGGAAPMTVDDYFAAKP